MRLADVLNISCDGRQERRQEKRDLMLFQGVVVAIDTAVYDRQINSKQQYA